MISEYYNKLLAAVESVRRITDFKPLIGIVLGSGLGMIPTIIKDPLVIDYNSIEGFPVSTVPGHAGRYVIGYIETVPVICMQGRVHYYEGYDMNDVVLPIRLMGLLGIKALFLSNAAGGCSRDMECGDLMLIRDHISSFVPNPLRGANIDELGPRFPDMTRVYDIELSQIISDSAKKLGTDLKEGIYMQLQGPSFETPAEIRLAIAMGADAVGMSTVCEAIAARHMGIRCCGVSFISNLASGLSDKLLSHEDVQNAAVLAGNKFKNLLLKSIIEMGKVL